MEVFPDIRIETFGHKKKIFFVMENQLASAVAAAANQQVDVLGGSQMWTLVPVNDGTVRNVCARRRLYLFYNARFKAAACKCFFCRLRP